MSLFLLLTGCSESRNTDPEQSYFLWSGKKATKDLKISHAQFIQDGGFLNEYTLFMELAPTNEWRDEFFKENELILDDESWSIPADAPVWFSPGKQYKRWKSIQPFAESLYLQDSVSGTMFIYEVE